ncbi:MAG: transaldolase [Actinomycetota bacterium]|nr:transaldolase [Actinomycetota bacterium]
MTDNLAALSALGVSIWLDDLDRGRLSGGGLADLIADSHVVGVTTNPSIFDHSITTGATAYAEQLHDLAVRGVDVNEAVRSLTAFDVRWACDLFTPTFAASGGADGRVSIEVDPRLARHTEATIAEAKALWWLVDRPNLLVKIPATVEGLPAITAALAQGISVNVTLIFSVARYREVMDAYMAGLEQASANGHDLSTIHSVASFFVSRVDSAVDAALTALDTPAATALLGQAGIANARVAWAAYEQVIAGARWQALAAKGANRQRPLWASTGVKNPAYPDDRYVVELAAPGCVNTMPEKTMDAVRGHGNVTGDTVSGTGPQAQQVFDELTAAGVDLDQVFVDLEDEGVTKFVEAWSDLLANLESSLAAARPAADPA